MIPKIIHYCWFGRKQKSELVKMCINSWRTFCPEYKILEWNEDNFDLTFNCFIQEAYAAEKWAFVTDFVRLHVLYEYGGIYMDTDTELIKNLDLFLQDNAFIGYETAKTISTSLIGAMKGNVWIRHCMSYYEERHFFLSDGHINDITNVEIITAEITVFYNINLDGKLRHLEDITLYPKRFFCPKNALSGRIDIMPDTYAIHHFDGSWLSSEEKEKKKRLEKYRKYFGWWLGLQIAEFGIEYEKKGVQGLTELFKTKFTDKFLKGMKENN
ncbi:MAG: hypothetical protein K2P14_03275 [Anaeroplasmataceae bacterium]|nr:hypothetical protein [Anaeroplasmataceae bacterium]